MDDVVHGVADEHAFGPAIGAVVPAGRDVARDGEIAERSFPLADRAEPVPSVRLLSRIAPAALEDLGDRAVGCDREGDVVTVWSDGQVRRRVIVVGGCPGDRRVERGGRRVEQQFAGMAAGGAAGDVVATGTPEGVALSGRFPYLVDGDVVELAIDGLGHQRHAMKAFN